MAAWLQTKNEVRQPALAALAAGLLLLSLLLAALRLAGAVGEASTSLKSAPASGVKMASSSIAITADGSLLLVVNPDSNSLTLINPLSQSVITELPVGIDPRSLAITPDGDLAFVANQGSNSLSIVDLQARAVVAHIPVGARPVGVTLSPDGRLAAVAESGSDTIRFLRTDSQQLASVIPVADRPYGLAFTPDGRFLLVSHLLSSDVTVVTIQPYHVFLPAAFNLAQAGSSPAESAGTADETAETDQRWLISGRPGTAPSPSVIVNEAGTRAYLPQTLAHGQGLNTQFDNTVFPKVSVLDLESWQILNSEHLPLPELDRPVALPWDAALRPGENELWVVNAASNDISVIDISQPTYPGRVTNIPVGHNPRGIVFNPSGSLAFVNNTLSGTVSVLDTATYSQTAEISATTIPMPPLLLQGKRLFHSSARPDLALAAWISCNTCHIEGQHDGRTWLLQYTGSIPPGGSPVITRNTTSLLGMIDTYPLRWSAEWDESADSEFSVRFEQFGSGLIKDGGMHPPLGEPNQGRSDDLDALAAFIDSLPMIQASQPLDPSQERGRLLFESSETQCASCHPPPLYTDLQTHDVGTASAYGEWAGPFIDTPTLRMLYDSAPYLHDGSAASLFQVLTSANANDAHGITSHLSEEEIADLIAFLLALPYQH